MVAKKFLPQMLSVLTILISIVGCCLPFPQHSVDMKGLYEHWLIKTRSQELHTPYRVRDPKPISVGEVSEEKNPAEKS